jgi:hypothetical protein
MFTRPPARLAHRFLPGGCGYGSDAYDFGWPETILQDYATAFPPPGVQAVVTNPPFKHAQQWIVKSLEDAPYSAFL